MINFIMSHYAIILIVVMIVIFAVIGSYADKIGFFVSYKEALKNKKELIRQQLDEEDALAVDEEKAPTEEGNAVYSDIDEALFAPIEGVNEYSSLNKEVSSVLSKRDLIDADLLSDIEHLSLDKTQRYNFGDIPDLDDVELPEIKKDEEEPEDIWKF